MLQHNAEKLVISINRRISKLNASSYLSLNTLRRIKLQTVVFLDVENFAMICTLWDCYIIFADRDLMQNKEELGTLSFMVAEKKTSQFQQQTRPMKQPTVTIHPI